MAFELIAKRTRQGIDKNSIAVSKYQITLGEDVVKAFGKNSSTEVYLDTDSKKVAFKPTSDSKTGFKLSEDDKTKKVTIHCSKVQKAVSKGVYVASSEKGMQVISVKLA